MVKLVILKTFKADFSFKKCKFAKTLWRSFNLLYRLDKYDQKKGNCS